MFAFQGFDACRLAKGKDAFLCWRALFERSELVRPPKTGVRPIRFRPDGASLVLGPFAETKGPRLPGRYPATPKITLTPELGSQLRVVHLPTGFYWQNPRKIPDAHCNALRPDP